MAENSAHLQVYLDGRLVCDDRVMDIGRDPGLEVKHLGHPVDGIDDIVPLKVIITGLLSRCPVHGDDDEPCC